MKLLQFPWGSPLPESGSISPMRSRELPWTCHGKVLRANIKTKEPSFLVEHPPLDNTVWEIFVLYKVVRRLNKTFFLAIQFAKLSGFSPIATTASLHNAEFLKTLGATHVIDRKADVVAEAKKIFSQPPTLIYDAVTNQTTEAEAIQILAPGGIILQVLPREEGRIVEGNKKIYTVFGSFYRHRELGLSLYPKLASLLESGKIKVSLQISL